MPFLLDLWGEQTFRHALVIIANPRTEIVMYSAAALGYLIDWAMGGIVRTVMMQTASLRLKDIDRQKTALVKRWGEEVTGAVPLDAQGYPLEKKVAAGAEESED